MAIKGKARAKSRSRAVAKPPRPVPVKVRPGFFLRRGVQVTGAFLAGIAVVLVAFWAYRGVHHEHVRSQNARALATARTAVASWKSTVDTALAQVQFDEQKQSIPAFAQLSATLDQMSKANVPSGAVSSAATLERTLKQAGDTLDTLSADTIRGKSLNALQATSLLDSGAAMAGALHTEENVAGLVQAAAGADRHARLELAARGKALATLAQSRFSDGYGEYFQIAVSLGLASGLPSPPTGGGTSGS